VVISALRADTRIPGCVVIEVDGARVASLPVEVLKALKLEIGVELSPDQQEQMLHASAVEGARRVALRLLATRPRAIQDLKRRLRDRGHDPRAIDESIQALQSSGLLDDAEFARHFVRVRSPRGHGPSRLIHDLLVVGVDRRVAEQAVQHVAQAEGIDLTAAARAIAERRAAQLEGLSVQRKRRRLLIYLARRGFRGHDVREMVTELVG
jgi:regulatory protein